MKRLLVFVFAVALLGSCAKMESMKIITPMGNLATGFYMKMTWSCMQKGMIHLEI